MLAWVEVLAYLSRNLLAWVIAALIVALSTTHTPRHHERGREQDCVQADHEAGHPRQVGCERFSHSASSTTRPLTDASDGVSQLTYRLLSRELGITSAAAKECVLILSVPLRPAHAPLRCARFLNAYSVDPQNAERAVSPIWLLSGELKPVHTANDAMDVDDDSSSTAASSAATPTARRAMLLVAHAQLDGSSWLSHSSQTTF